MFPLIFCSLFLEMTKTCQPRTLIHHNVPVCSKFVRARTHAHSLEGTLRFGISTDEYAPLNFL